MIENVLIEKSSQTLTNRMGIVNMSKQNKEAYNRGVKAAGIWRQLKKLLANCDQRCTVWARNHNAPAWVGRIPLVTAILASLTGIIAGGLFIAFIVVFIWAIAFILQHADIKKSVEDEDSRPHGPGYRYGQDGFGYYSGSDDITSDRID